MLFGFVHLKAYFTHPDDDFMGMSLTNQLWSTH